MRPLRIKAVQPLGLLLGFGLTGCGGHQSALNPAGVEAEQLSQLFWVMTAGALLIWLIMLALMFLVPRVSWPADRRRRTARWLIGAGIAWPTVTLTALLIWTLPMIGDLRAGTEALRIEVDGEQWWWRVRYQRPDGTAVVSANEIRLPVDTPVRFILRSRDVIHSFWIPSLGGKMDMIPGRANELLLHATRTGTFRGVCAEYCGASHAHMAFFVQVMAPHAFERWLAHQAEDARPPIEPAAQQGQQLFQQHGCGGCHSVRGTSAVGDIGPDLTHVGGRLSIGAGILPNDASARQRWLKHTDTVKPGVLMPPFHHLPEAELSALASYLSSLQ